MTSALERPSYFWQPIPQCVIKRHRTRSSSWIIAAFLCHIQGIHFPHARQTAHIRMPKGNGTHQICIGKFGGKMPENVNNRSSNCLCTLQGVQTAHISSDILIERNQTQFPLFVQTQSKAGALMALKCAMALSPHIREEMEWSHCRFETQALDKTPSLDVWRLPVLQHVYMYIAADWQSAIQSCENRALSLAYSTGWLNVLLFKWTYWQVFMFNFIRYNSFFVPYGTIWFKWVGRPCGSTCGSQPYWQ